ncbi:MAG: hypothetical protein U0230_15450 [Polyangiales bacterium]
MGDDTESRHAILAFIAAIGGRATLGDLVPDATVDDRELLRRELTTLSEEGLLEVPYGPLETGLREARLAWLRRYRPGQGDEQVYELTSRGRHAARELGPGIPAPRTAERG